MCRLGHIGNGEHSYAHTQCRSAEPKYEKGTNGVSSIRLLQLANYLKVPVNYFFEDFPEYLINLEKSEEGHVNINYNFLVKIYSELNNDQKLKFSKSLEIIRNKIPRAV